MAKWWWCRDAPSPPRRRPNVPDQRTKPMEIIAILILSSFSHSARFARHSAARTHFLFPFSCYCSVRVLLASVPITTDRPAARPHSARHPIWINSKVNRRWRACRYELSSFCLFVCAERNENIDGKLLFVDKMPTAFPFIAKFLFGRHTHRESSSVCAAYQHNNVTQHCFASLPPRAPADYKAVAIDTTKVWRWWGCFVNEKSVTVCMRHAVFKWLKVMSMLALHNIHALPLLSSYPVSRVFFSRPDSLSLVFVIIFFPSAVFARAHSLVIHITGTSARIQIHDERYLFTRKIESWHSVCCENGRMFVCVSEYVHHEHWALNTRVPILRPTNDVEWSSTGIDGCGGRDEEKQTHTKR